jgi:hypothetical protein
MVLRRVASVLVRAPLMRRSRWSWSSSFWNG